MMSFPSPSHNHMTHQSHTLFTSQCFPRVVCQLRTISFSARTELLRLVHPLALRVSFLAASERMEDRLEASLAEREIVLTCIRWALLGITGLVIDEQPAGVDQLLEAGPENLVLEIFDYIQGRLRISAAEAKN
jgi:hypothetical protein